MTRPDVVLHSFELAFGRGEGGAVLHPEPIQLAGELVAELLEQVLAQQLLLQRLQHARFDFIPADRQLVRARALVASSRSSKAVRGAHDEAGTTAALGQSGEEVARAVRRRERARRHDRVARLLLTLLRSRPQFGRNDPHVRNVRRDPLGSPIQSRHLACVRVLHIRSRFHTRRPTYSSLFRIPVPRFGLP